MALTRTPPAAPFGAQLARHLRDSAHAHTIGKVTTAERRDASEGANIYNTVRRVSGE